MITMMYIRYTVKAEYAAQNSENIRRVMDNLRTLQRPDLRYNVFVEEDGKTFIHLPIFENEEAKKVFEAQEAFQVFQAGLRESVPEVPPKVTNLTLVGSSHDLFS